jgi:hypothetical protein
MKILSFDVGIKNLAYCLLETETETEKDKSYKIIDWGVIDLMPTLKFNCVIHQKKKPNVICNKTASFIDINGKYYCKQHAKSSNFIIPTKELHNTYIKRAKLGELKEICDKYSIKYNTPILKKKLIELIDDFKKKNCLATISKEKNEGGLVGVSITMTKIFDGLFKDKNIDCILIENQISKIASTMKTIQGMITQYFVMENIYDIHYVSSYNKLKLFIPSRKILTYKERKDLGVKITREKLLENNDLEWDDFFIKHKKKDDLADSLLQGLWYINNI